MNTIGENLMCLQLMIFTYWLITSCILPLIGTMPLRYCWKWR